MSQPRELKQHKNTLGLCSPKNGERERFKLQEKKEEHERIKELLKTGIADERSSLKLALIGSNHF